MEGKLDEALAIYQRRERMRDSFEVVTADNKGVCLPLHEFLYFSSQEKSRVTAFTTGGEITLRASDTLPKLEERLKDNPQFMRTHSSYLVNLDRAATVAPVSKREWRLMLKGAPGQAIPVTEMYAEGVRNYLGLESLDHVIPWNQQMAAIISEKLRKFKKDIRYMSAAELRANFSDSTGQLVVKQLMGNIIWQAFNWIKEEKIPLFEGNLRSFWYSHIKPVIARLGMALDGQYKVMSGIFTQYTAVYGLFCYKDFGFADDNERYRIIGKTNPEVIVCAEKMGHWKTLELLNAQYGITIIALGGQPSQLSTEYFVDELKTVIDLKKTFYLFGITDYDPAGWTIAESFAAQLAVQGIYTIENVEYGDTMSDIKDMKKCHLIMPEYFTAEEIELNKYPVPQETPEQQTKVKNWLKKGGGINGEACGLEADAMERTKLRALFYEKAKDHLKPAAPTAAGRKLLERYDRKAPTGERAKKR